MTRDELMSDVKRALLERPLTDEERESHCEAGEGFHVPVIVSRCGGVSPKLLNTCGICGANIVPVGDGWIPISDADANHMREVCR